MNNDDYSRLAEESFRDMIEAEKIDKLTKQLEIAKACLEFYADTPRLSRVRVDDVFQHTSKEIDLTEPAREALKEIEAV